MSNESKVLQFNPRRHYQSSFQNVFRLLKLREYRKAQEHLKNMGEFGVPGAKLFEILIMILIGHTRAWPAAIQAAQKLQVDDFLSLGMKIHRTPASYHVVHAAGWVLDYEWDQFLKAEDERIAERIGQISYLLEFKEQITRQHDVLIEDWRPQLQAIGLIEQESFAFLADCYLERHSLDVAFDHLLSGKSSAKSSFYFRQVCHRLFGKVPRHERMELFRWGDGTSVKSFGVGFLVGAGVMVKQYGIFGEEPILNEKNQPRGEVELVQLNGFQWEKSAKDFWQKPDEVFFGRIRSAVDRLDKEAV